MINEYVIEVDYALFICWNFKRVFEECPRGVVVEVMDCGIVVI